LVTLVWNGGWMSKGSRSLWKIFLKTFIILFWHQKLQHLLPMALHILWRSSTKFFPTRWFFIYIHNLCNSSNEDGMLPNSLYPSKSLLHMNHYNFVYTNSPYSIKHIPYVGTPFVLNVVDCFRAMWLAVHFSSELR
jgi:hypothetical protein